MMESVKFDLWSSVPRLNAVESGVCSLPEAPPWGFVRMSWPHRGSFATLFLEKGKCPGGGG